MAQRKQPGSPVTADDSDLEDLLAKDGDDDRSKKEEHLSETNLNLDYLTQGQLDVPFRKYPHVGVADLAHAHCSYLCYAHPYVCTCFTVSVIAFVIVAVVNILVNPTLTFGVIPNDYTNIQSEYDLSLGKIDHWCLKGDNDSCRCEDPLEPTGRLEFKSWVTAHRENKKSIVPYLNNKKPLDVAFLGESLVEEMDGRWMGQTHTDQLKDMAKSFEKRFQQEMGGVEGVALGIAGDTSPNVLYRLLHGEMVPEFNPKIWWVSLGMNDIGRMQCSEEVVVLGILRVVEEIRTRKPTAKIVINSMLPMADLRGGIYPHAQDYRDAFKKYKGKPSGTVPATYTAKNPVHDDPPVKRSLPPPATKQEQLDDSKKDTKKVRRGDKRMVMRRLLSADHDDPARQLKKRGKKRGNERDSDEEEPNVPLTKEDLKRIRQKEPYNPKITTNREQVKKFNSKKLFLQENQLPLWTSIHAINEELRKFCDNNKDITFFDATDIFAVRSEANSYILQSDLISMRGHPTVAGFEKWEDAILDKIQNILKKESEEADKKLQAYKASSMNYDAGDDDDDGSQDNNVVDRETGEGFSSESKSASGDSKKQKAADASANAGSSDSSSEESEEE